MDEARKQTNKGKGDRREEIKITEIKKKTQRSAKKRYKNDIKYISRHFKIYYHNKYSLKVKLCIVD